MPSELEFKFNMENNEQIPESPEKPEILSGEVEPAASISQSDEKIVPEAIPSDLNIQEIEIPVPHPNPLPRQIEGGQAEGEGLPAEEKYDPLKVKIEAFDGPFDLLLELIKKNEMNICDIQISEITKQYLDYLHQLQELNLDIAGEYLVMAATLVYIKSKMLLPLETMEENSETGEDPRTELVRKLLEYQAFKEAAKELGFLEHERGKIFTRQIADYYLSNISSEDVEIDTFSADLYDLMQAFHTVLQTASKDKFHEVFDEVITIEQKFEELKGRLTEKGFLWFFELFESQVTKNEIIVTFLALLELVRSKYVSIFQDKQFGDIKLIKIAQIENPVKTMIESRGNDVG